ncbi:hypothetical protein HGRIS_007469 [Hohenbuehelia grisea]
MTLLNDDNADEIRFFLPMCVGERYGVQPVELEGAAALSRKTRVRISSYVQTSGRLIKISSPTHGDDVKEERYSTNVGRPSRRRTRMKYKSKSFLEKDFVLIIHAERLDEPRCFAEVAYPSSGVGSNTVAFQLTLVPKAEGILPSLADQEYLFLIDRSGSMKDGRRIETAKETLSILLRMLPAEQTSFNLYSFGSEVDKLWVKSREYHQMSLSSAIRHVNSMAADYRGTDILAAIQNVFSTRNTSKPTAVFILTDGKVHNVSEVVTEVQLAVKKAAPNSPLRVFVLGIGDGVSTSMCESIATAGNGVSLFATDAESIAGKCARLFRAGRMQLVKKVTVDWGVPREHLVSNAPQVNFLSGSTAIQLRAPSPLQQSPSEIQEIHAGTRVSIYAILALRNLQVPKEVTIRGELEDSNDDFELKVPIRGVQLVESDSDLRPIRMLDDQPPIHTLAAWRLIQDQQENVGPVPQGSNGASEGDFRKAAIIRLGEQYRLASRYTSFVVVDDGQDDAPTRHGPGRASHQQNRSSNQSPPERTLEPAQGVPLETQESWGSAFTSFFTGDRARQPFPGAWPGQRSRSPSPAPDIHDDDDGYQSARTFSTLSSLESYSDWSDWSRAPTPPPISEEDAQMLRCPSPLFAEVPSGGGTRAASAPAAVGAHMQQAPLNREVVKLMNLLRFDGSLVLDAELTKVMGIRFDDKMRQQTDQTVWATALGIAFLKKHAPGQEELWEKATSFVKAQAGHQDILARAAAALEAMARA